MDQDQKKESKVTDPISKENDKSTKKDTIRPIESLSIILPCYNEEGNIPRFTKELIPVLTSLKEAKNIDFEILAIDDGSKDKTLELLHKFKEEFPSKVIIKEHKKNQGLGAAVKTGIAAASKSHTITLDADFTFHPKLIPSLIECYNTHNQNKHTIDFVNGSPTLNGYDKSIPTYRKILSVGAKTLFNIALTKKFTAITPIFRLYQTKDIKKLNIQSTGFDINAEIMAKLLLQKKRFKEIPAKLTVRIYGESKINNFREIKNHIILLTKILKWRIFSTQ